MALFKFKMRINSKHDLLLVGYSHEHDYEVVATSSDHLARVYSGEDFAHL